MADAGTRSYELIRVQFHALPPDTVDPAEPAASGVRAGRPRTGRACRSASTAAPWNRWGVRHRLIVDECEAAGSAVARGIDVHHICRPHRVDDGCDVVRVGCELQCDFYSPVEVGDAHRLDGRL
jgi:hypothetical protein